VLTWINDFHAGYCQITSMSLVSSVDPPLRHAPERYQGAIVSRSSSIGGMFTTEGPLFAA